jgi:hypothetical protein
MKPKTQADYRRLIRQYKRQIDKASLQIYRLEQKLFALLTAADCYRLLVEGSRDMALRGKLCGEGDKDIAASFAADAREVEHIAALVKAGKLAEAAKEARHLDSFVRDNLHPDAYEFLMRYQQTK